MSDEIHAEVIIVGAGISGALAATELARQGVKVAVLDCGPRVDRAEAVQIERQSTIRGIPESPYPDLPYAPRPSTLDPKFYLVQEGPEMFGSNYERRVGGTTWHWLGTTLRLQPHDFKLKSTYGVGVDWPIDYDDLEPWYVKAEHEIGVAGVDNPDLGAPRSKPYPMPPIPQSYLDKQWTAAAKKIGLRVVSTPQGRNSVAYDGRPPCCGNNNCIPICPIGAKYDGSVHVAKAEKLGAQIVAPAVVRKVDVTASGVTVEFLRPDGSKHTASGKTLVLAAHAIETPKLMLLSTGSAHPRGLGNDHDLVGRYLMDHPTQLSWALSSRPVFPYRGPLATSGIEMLRDGKFRAKRGAFRIEIGNDGWSWPVGDQTVQAAQQAKRGKIGKQGFTELRNELARHVRLASLVEPLPDRENRVRLANEVDSLGIARPRLNYRTGDYATAGLHVARETHQRLFEALGATEIHHWPGPQGAGHIMGTCRMGTDPASSVVDEKLRVHGKPNCFVLGSSVYPSVGTANPTLTIAALALRAVPAIKASLVGP